MRIHVIVYILLAITATATAAVSRHATHSDRLASAAAAHRHGHHHHPDHTHNINAPFRGLPLATTATPIQPDPKSVGVTLVQNLLARAPPPQNESLTYQEVCTAFGALKVAGVLENRALIDAVVGRYACVLTDPACKGLIPTNWHVDAFVFGSLPLEITRLTGDPRWRALGLQFADAQFARTTADGLTTMSRFWCDDLYMITGLQMSAYLLSANLTYAENAAREVLAYLAVLQRTSGLMNHSQSAGDIAWGRANGWVAAALTLLLQDVPASFPSRPALLLAYQILMAAFRAVQPTEDPAMWRQVLDYEPAWLESSSTGMFLFALATGVRLGWLDSAIYLPVVLRGWTALAGSYIETNGDVREVCIGTGPSFNVQDYLDRPRVTGDLHGQAGAVWAAHAMMLLEL